MLKALSNSQSGAPSPMTNNTHARYSEPLLKRQLLCTLCHKAFRLRPSVSMPNINRIPQQERRAWGLEGHP